MTAGPADDRRVWVLRSVGLFLGGAAGAVGVRHLAAWLVRDETPLLPLLVATGLAAVAVGLPLWRGALRRSRTGPWWAGLVGAWIPAVLVAALAVAAVAAGDVPPSAAPGAAALLLLAAVPLTLTLAAVGALLEYARPRVGAR